MESSTFFGELNMDSIEVGKSLYMRKAKFPSGNEIHLYFARIGSNLDISGATVGAIDLTAATVAGELRLGSAKKHKPTNWVSPSRMVLRNTKVGAIQDAHISTDSWPLNLELEGFTYSYLGGFGAEGQADIANRPTNWFTKWLERDKNFSPQPYQHLANMLLQSGYPAKANAIRFAARKQSRRNAWENRELRRWIGLTCLQYFIGYGVGAKYLRVLWWFGSLTLIGFIVLLTSVEKSNWDLFTMVWASFDQVLPIVTLNKGHETFITTSCSSWAITYFYFQKLFGYVLAGFLGAGLAGLTQKN
jgi:hypothetical protein